MQVAPTRAPLGPSATAPTGRTGGFSAPSIAPTIRPSTAPRTQALTAPAERCAAPSGRDFVAKHAASRACDIPTCWPCNGASYHDGRAGLWADGSTARHSARVSSAPARCREKNCVRVLGENWPTRSKRCIARPRARRHQASKVMLDARPVILMDFGAARFQRRRQRDHAGTPRYLAPEIVAGKPGTQAVDLYAWRRACASAGDESLSRERAGLRLRLRPRGLRAMWRSCSIKTRARGPPPLGFVICLQRLIDAPRRRVRSGLLPPVVVVGLTGIAMVEASACGREHAQRQVAERVSEFLASLYREHDPLSRDASSARPPELLIADAGDARRERTGAGSVARHGCFG